MPRQLRALLNAGYRASGTVTRVETVEGVRMPIDYPVYSPKALAGIGNPFPPTVRDRSILIEMRRRASGERVSQFRLRDASARAKRVREGLERLAEPDTIEALAQIRPKFPTGLRDRDADQWEPLLAIADFAGGTWPERARAAAVALTVRVGDEPDPGVQILRDIYNVFAKTMRDRLTSADLVARLANLDDPAYEGPPLTPQTLAQRLELFGVRPQMHRMSTTLTRRGYERSDFDPSWRQYGIGVETTGNEST